MSRRGPDDPAHPRPARAIIGHYTAGVPNTHDFFIPPEEGLFFAPYTYFYHTDSFRDRNGNPVDRLIVPPRLRPPSTLPLDVKLNQVALSPAFLWLPHFTLLGARYGAFLSLGAANANVSAAVEVIDRGKQFETGWGFADVYVQPLWLQWSLWRLDLAASYGFYAPTGRFWLGGMLETDVLGYDQWQVGFDQGPDQSRLLSGVLDSVHAAGFQLGSPKWGISLKYLHEFEARQRFQGQIVTLTFGLPLDPLVDLVKGLVQ